METKLFYIEPETQVMPVITEGMICDSIQENVLMLEVDEIESFDEQNLYF